jgi:hypothetical protein
MRCPQKTVLAIIVHLSYYIWNSGLLAHPWRMRLCSQQKASSSFFLRALTGTP